MQLTCPACGARYEIDEGLIPPEGRSVQCSVCEHVWREGDSRLSEPSETRQAGTAAPTAKPETAPGGAPAVGAAPGAARQAPPTPRPPLADEVRAILRDEANRETRVRRERGLIEIQPDLGLAPGKAAPARRRAHGAGALPDPDKINETLRAASQRAAELHGARPRRAAGGGFLTGLLLGLCLVGLAALLYVAAPRIAAAVPDADPALRAYVAAVDDTRIALDRAARRLATAASDLME